jgi:hypothetical protein
VFENRVLKTIFVPKGEEVTVTWRKVHMDEVNDLYPSSNIFPVIKSRRMRRAGHVALMWESTGVYRIFVGKSEGKRPLERRRQRWEENSKMDHQEMG